MSSAIRLAAFQAWLAAQQDQEQAPSTPSPARAVLILKELDAQAAPDLAYRSGFSTFSKVGLGQGETWRSRLVAWAERQSCG
jgi:hypothetical protein